MMTLAVVLCDPPYSRQVRNAGEAAAFLVDGSADFEQTGKRDPGKLNASAAKTAAAMPAFMSHIPRPMTRPSRTTPSKGFTVKPRPGGTTSM